MDEENNVQIDREEIPLLSNQENHGDFESTRTTSTSHLTLDEAFELCGSFGRFQFLHQLCIMYIFATLAYQVLLSYFIGDDPAWTCANTNDSTITSSSNSTKDFCTVNMGKIVHPNDTHFHERCKLPRHRWMYAQPVTYSYITEFDLACERKYLGALATAAIYIGGTLQIFTGFLLDQCGRKIVLWVSLYVSTCMSIACFFVTSVWQLICVRVVLGCALFTCYSGLLVLLLEFLPRKSRALSTSVYLCAFTVSVLLMDAVAYNVRNWRHLNIFLCLPTIPAILLFFVIPKSPRWLLSRDRKIEVVQVLQHISFVNRKPVQEFSLRPTVATNRVFTYLHIFQDGEMFFMTLCLGLIYCSLALVYYEIGLEANYFGGNIYATFAYASLADVPGFLLAFLLCDRCGRKSTVLGGLLLSGLALAVIAAVPSWYTHAYAIKVTLAMLSKVFVNLGFTASYVWGIESFPTGVRAQAGSFCAVMEKIGALCIPLFTSFLNTVDPILIFIIVGAFAVGVSILGLTQSDTKNLPMREKYDEQANEYQ